MALDNWRDTTLTILSGAAESEELNLSANHARRRKNLTFFCPATLPETVTVQVAPAVGGTYGPLNDGFGNDVVLVAGKSQVQVGITAGALKLVSSGNVAADRAFRVQGAAESVVTG